MRPLLSGSAEKQPQIILKTTLRVRVPVLWFLQQFTDMGAEAVGVTMMVSNICVGVTAVIVAIPVILKIQRLAREEG